MNAVVSLDTARTGDVRYGRVRARLHSRAADGTAAEPF
jgi:hypothetical protein